MASTFLRRPKENFYTRHYPVMADRYALIEPQKPAPSMQAVSTRILQYCPIGSSAIVLQNTNDKLVVARGTFVVDQLVNQQATLGVATIGLEAYAIIADGARLYAKSTFDDRIPSGKFVHDLAGDANPMASIGVANLKGQDATIAYATNNGKVAIINNAFTEPTREEFSLPSVSEVVAVVNSGGLVDVFVATGEQGSLHRLSAKSDDAHEAPFAVFNAPVHALKVAPGLPAKSRSAHVLAMIRPPVPTIPPTPPAGPIYLLDMKETQNGIWSPGWINLSGSSGQLNTTAYDVAVNEDQTVIAYTGALGATYWAVESTQASDPTNDLWRIWNGPYPVAQVEAYKQQPSPNVCAATKCWCSEQCRQACSTGCLPKECGSECLRKGCTDFCTDHPPAPTPETGESVGTESTDDKQAQLCGILYDCIEQLVISYNAKESGALWDLAHGVRLESFEPKTLKAVRLEAGKMHTLRVFSATTLAKLGATVSSDGQELAEKLIETSADSYLPYTPFYSRNELIASYSVEVLF